MKSHEHIEYGRFFIQFLFWYWRRPTLSLAFVESFTSSSHRMCVRVCVWMCFKWYTLSVSVLHIQKRLISNSIIGFFLSLFYFIPFHSINLCRKIFLKEKRNKCSTCCTIWVNLSMNRYSEKKIHFLPIFTSAFKQMPINLTFVSFQLHLVGFICFFFFSFLLFCFISSSAEHVLWNANTTHTKK